MKIVLMGAAGRMGQAITKRLEQEKDLTLGAAWDIALSQAYGRRQSAPVQNDRDLKRLLSKGDVIVDFSAPLGTVSVLSQAVLLKKPIVIGTTGFKPYQEKQIMRGALHIPIVFSSNMSVGVNVVFSLLADAARKLGAAYDVEIVEMHHRNKKDAPSGTALRMGKVIAEARGMALEKAGRFVREGMMGVRPDSEIGIQSLRGGDVVGEHTVIFAGPGERIEITHKAHSRDNFARGALLAARWVMNQPPGLYDMMDVLNLSHEGGGFEPRPKTIH